MSRRTAGWCVLALIPLMIVGLAALAGQLLEFAVGASIAGFLLVVAGVGIGLLDDEPRNRN